MSLILASGSPRRQELLKRITEDFTVSPVDADETLPDGIPTDMAAAYLADLKAAAAAKLFPDDTVLGCDTIVILNDEIMGKPKDRDDAHRMLRALSGESHSVLTGCSLYHGKQTTVFTTETLVTFYPLSDAEIEAYLDTGEPFDKAGAYGIQGKGSLLVREIEGDYFNVVGLPVAALSRQLRQFESLIARPKIHLKHP
ncbi:MAG: Maf family protein [Oscillospiraceae bacterium]|nr:Maf family protein [Oscillospiraceae bacterium]